MFSASLIRLILPQITSKNASQNAIMQVKMQVKISPINAKNPDYHISGNPGISFILASYRQITGKLKYLIPVIGKDIGLRGKPAREYGGSAGAVMCEHSN